MRTTPLSLLVTLLLTCASLQAEEVALPPPQAASVDTLSQELEQRLAQSEQLRNEQQASSAVQLQRLRQENQRLRMQLKESQAQAQPRVLSEEQTWFALGAALSLASMLFGTLLRGSRKTRREWIN
ncbi:translation initiation factor 2 (IF-2, GTPase) [Pseudomonas yangonensis]|uniref:translation initiation factor 2 (IF-2, GTPase) n=1 Tax=Pseudomonas yangonensis TaxID=2579922 RepID=UPI00137A8CDD|nr:translation initiation factor 2 (IF-2, GTPase) [Pseudomonas yangonensis]